MVEQLVARQREMQQRHASAASAALRQSTMTQQYAQEEEEVLPEGWIRMWDNPGKRHYYFNTVDHAIQYDRVKVLEIVALAGTLEGEETSIRPDGVVSSNNNTITPSPIHRRKSPSDSSDAASLTTFGGFVEIDDSDDNEFVATPAKKSPRMMAERPRIQFATVPKKNKAEWCEDSDEDSYSGYYNNEVSTQDLPGTQDFGYGKDFDGASALALLRSPGGFKDTDDSFENTDDDNDKEN
jgi:hypothetical protein